MAVALEHGVAQWSGEEVTEIAAPSVTSSSTISLTVEGHVSGESYKQIATVGTRTAGVGFTVHGYPNTPGSGEAIKINWIVIN